VPSIEHLRSLAEDADKNSGSPSELGDRPIPSCVSQPSTARLLEFVPIVLRTSIRESSTPAQVYETVPHAVTAGWHIRSKHQTLAIPPHTGDAKPLTVCAVKTGNDGTPVLDGDF